MDFAQASFLIDDVYSYLLTVRDLASGKVLLWQPVWSESAAVVRAALVPLFLAFGNVGIDPLRERVRGFARKSESVRQLGA